MTTSSTATPLTTASVTAAHKDIRGCSLRALLRELISYLLPVVLIVAVFVTVRSLGLFTLVLNGAEVWWGAAGLTAGVLVVTLGIWAVVVTGSYLRPAVAAGATRTDLGISFAVASALAVAAGALMVTAAHLVDRVMSRGANSSGGVPVNLNDTFSDVALSFDGVVGASTPGSLMPILAAYLVYGVLLLVGSAAATVAFFRFHWAVAVLLAVLIGPILPLVGAASMGFAVLSAPAVALLALVAGAQAVVGFWLLRTAPIRPGTQSA